LAALVVLGFLRDAEFPSLFERAAFVVIGGFLEASLFSPFLIVFVIPKDSFLG